MNKIIEKLKLPLILLVVLLIPLFFGKYIPMDIKAIFYSLSLSIKAILIFVLPFIIFSFIFSCLTSLKSGVVKFVLLLIACVFCSNMIAIMLGYSSGTFFLSLFDIPAGPDSSQIIYLLPTWELKLPKIIPNEAALIAGFIIGMYFSISRNDKAVYVAGVLNKYANLLLRKGFIPILPLFILGFVFKLEQDEILTTALKVYGPVLFLVVGTQISYMFLVYAVASNFSLSQMAKYFKNVLPATITGLSTISSAAALPVLIISSEKNIEEKGMAETIIPATINIHTLGSAIGMTILILTTLSTFGMHVDFQTFMIFALYYALAKFAVAAVPGGVIIVVVPLLETHLGFSSDMIGLITAMYLLFDPFGTATNVTGNGAFAIIFTKIYKFFTKKNDSSSTREPLS